MRRPTRSIDIGGWWTDRRAAAARVDRLGHHRRFPGETDDDFELNREYLTGSPLSHLTCFPIRIGPGTEATAMTEKVPGR